MNIIKTKMIDIIKTLQIPDILTLNKLGKVMSTTVGALLLSSSLNTSTLNASDLGSLGNTKAYKSAADSIQSNDDLYDGLYDQLTQAPTAEEVKFAEQEKLAKTALKAKELSDFSANIDKISKDYELKNGKIPNPEYIYDSLSKEDKIYFDKISIYDKMDGDKNYKIGEAIVNDFLKSNKGNPIFNDLEEKHPNDFLHLINNPELTVGGMMFQDHNNMEMQLLMRNVEKIALDLTKKTIIDSIGFAVKTNSIGAYTYETMNTNPEIAELINYVLINAGDIWKNDKPGKVINDMYQTIQKDFEENGKLYSEIDKGTINFLDLSESEIDTAYKYLEKKITMEAMKAGMKIQDIDLMDFADSQMRGLPIIEGQDTPELTKFVALFNDCLEMVRDNDRDMGDN